MEDKTFELVTDLAHAVTKLEQLFTRQNDTMCRMQEDFRELIKANLEMVRSNSEMARTLQLCREDYKDMLSGYREELHDAKRQYNRVSELFVVETSKKLHKEAVAKNDVNINM